MNLPYNSWVFTIIVLQSLCNNSATPSAAFSVSDKLTELEKRVLGLEQNSASESAFLSMILNNPLSFSNASSSAQLFGDITSLSLNTEQATVSGTLSVLGRTTLSDVGITGNLAVGLLSFDSGLTTNDQGLTTGPSINTLAGDLRLQSQGLGGIDILAGKVTIDVEGNIVTQGTVTAKEVKTEQLTITNSTPTASGSAVLGANIGTTTLPANATKVTIQTTALNSNSKVFITATTKTSEPLSVENQQPGESFDVVVPSPTPSAIQFNWWIVQTE